MRDFETHPVGTLQKIANQQDAEIKRLREVNSALWEYFHVASECVFVECPTDEQEIAYTEVEEKLFALMEVE